MRRPALHVETNKKRSRHLAFTNGRHGEAFRVSSSERTPRPGASFIIHPPPPAPATAIPCPGAPHLPAPELYAWLVFTHPDAHHARAIQLIRRGWPSVGDHPRRRRRDPDTSRGIASVGEGEARRARTGIGRMDAPRGGPASRDATGGAVGVDGNESHALHAPVSATAKRHVSTCRLGHPEKEPGKVPLGRTSRTPLLTSVLTLS